MTLTLYSSTPGGAPCSNSVLFTTFIHKHLLGLYSGWKLGGWNLDFRLLRSSKKCQMSIVLKRNSVVPILWKFVPTTYWLSDGQIIIAIILIWTILSTIGHIIGQMTNSLVKWLPASVILKQIHSLLANLECLANLSRSIGR